MQTEDCGRIRRIGRHIGGGASLVNWPCLLTFSSNSAPRGALPIAADCATLRPLPPPAVASPRARRTSRRCSGPQALGAQGPSDDCAAILVTPRAEARGTPSALDHLCRAVGGAAGAPHGGRLLPR